MAAEDGDRHHLVVVAVGFWLDITHTIPPKPITASIHDHTRIQPPLKWLSPLRETETVAKTVTGGYSDVPSTETKKKKKYGKWRVVLPRPPYRARLAQ